VYRRFGKRLLDLTLTIPGLLLLLPALAVIALLIRFKLGSPVLFRMQRPGFMGRPFVLYKFRTMKDGWDAHAQPLPDEERLTPFGERLRGLSLDELPELFNVMKGDMSLVGPRPLRMEYLEWYSVGQRRRHDVLPGITGWAQINGRNSLTFEEKLDLDLWYVHHQSLRLDLKILFRTFPQVIARRNVDYSANATVSDVVNRLRIVKDADRLST
jgi:lipopolysaccharide/colanic/teichoic acid biosynthesis glycosyltransferase